MIINERAGEIITDTQKMFVFSLSGAFFMEEKALQNTLKSIVYRVTGTFERLALYPASDYHLILHRYQQLHYMSPR